VNKSIPVKTRLLLMWNLVKSFCRLAIGSNTTLLCNEQLKVFDNGQEVILEFSKLGDIYASASLARSIARGMLAAAQAVDPIPAAQAVDPIPAADRGFGQSLPEANQVPELGHCMQCQAVIHLDEPHVQEYGKGTLCIGCSDVGKEFPL
jgi:hypothetical protein